ncbi:MAG: GNAT family N-acetyltransferase [Clostridiales bacterium]|nr:GNAT family N-acetyltransferase [Clostridiales bacterium]
MVKFIEGEIPEEIFTFLGSEKSAVLSSFTSLFPTDWSDSVISVQYDNNKPMSVFSSFSGSSLLFLSEGSDMEELSFGLESTIYTMNTIDADLVDELYLLSSHSCPSDSVKDCDMSLIPLEIIIRDKKIIDIKQQLSLKGRCKAYALETDGRIISFGLVSFCDEYSVITDLYTLPEFRKHGYASETIQGLLSLAPTDTVYAVSEKKNLDLYKKQGFTLCRTIGKYSIRRK